MSKQEPQFESAIYRGFVRHRRHRPRTHAFKYKLFMLWLKVDEIPALLQHLRLLGTSVLSWARFRRQDYIGDPAQSISASVRSRMASISGRQEQEFNGEVFMLCQLRYLGIYFSPLNLYFLRQHGRFTYMLAEVSNTPWNERHYYLIDLAEPGSHAKAFHVSPFNPMQQTYSWRIEPPAANTDSCLVHIDVCSESDGNNTVFDASLSLQRQAMNQAHLWRVLIRHPAQTATIVAGIYWQALKLFLKGLPYFQHPDKQQTKSQAQTREGRL